MRIWLCLSCISEVSLGCWFGLAVLRISIFIHIVLLVINSMTFLDVIWVWNISWGLIIGLRNLILAQIMWVITLRGKFWWTLHVMRNHHSLVLRLIGIWPWWFLLHFIITWIFSIFLITLRYWLVWIICNITFILCLFHNWISFPSTILAVQLFSHLAIWNIRYVISILFLACFNSCLTWLNESRSETHLSIRVQFNQALLLILDDIFYHRWLSLSMASLRLHIFRLVNRCIFYLLFINYRFPTHFLVVLYRHFRYLLYWRCFPFVCFGLE